MRGTLTVQQQLFYQFQHFQVDLHSLSIKNYNRFQIQLFLTHDQGCRGVGAPQKDKYVKYIRFPARTQMMPKKNTSLFFKFLKVYVEIRTTFG